MCSILHTLCSYIWFLMPVQKKDKEVKKTLLDWHDENYNSKRNGRNFYPLKITSIKSSRELLSSKGIRYDFTEERGIHDILFGNSKLFSKDEIVFVASPFIK